MRSSMLLGGGAAAVGGTTWAGEHAGDAPSPSGPVFDVRDFGAAGDGRTRDTRAIQHAIDAAHRLGGGIVRLPAGTWLSGTLHLRSRVTVDIGPGAVLLASPSDADFAPPAPLSFATGSDIETIDFANALLAGRNLERIAIVGGGVIDMNRTRRGGPKPIALKRCRFVTVRDLTVRHAPNYCVSLGACDDVQIEGVTIRDAYADGIDPDCCRRVRIANCDVESDDDALCLKTSFLLGARRVTEDVLVTNCRLKSPSNCFKLGTESSGDFHEIALSNCVFSGLRPEGRDVSDAAEGGGIAILTVDGGSIDGVTVCNVVMNEVPAPLFLRLGNRGRDQTEPAPGRLRNVSISGIVARGVTGTCSITGLAGHPIERLRIENVIVVAAGDARGASGLDVPERPRDYPKVTMYGALPAFGLYLRHAQDVMLRNVEFAVDGADPRPALLADDVAGLNLAGLIGRSGNEAGPIVWLNDVRGGAVQGSLAPQGVDVFLRVSGENTHGIALVGNAFCTPRPVVLAPEVAASAIMPLGNPGGAEVAGRSS
jgi:hypothetical protein